MSSGPTSNAGASPEEFITNLTRDENGVLRAAGASEVSYPEDGHEICHAVEEKSFWFRHRNRALQAVIAAFPPPADLPFMDVGGGNGYVATAVRDLGHRVVVVEPGEAGARFARSRGIAEVVQASIVDLEVLDGSVGGIGLFDVLEHIEDDADALRRLRRMLVRGGRLYVTVPAHRWLWTSVDVTAGHHRRYTRRTLRRALTEAGFEVSFLSYYFWPLALPMMLYRVVPERLGLRRSESRPERVAREHGQTHVLMSRALRWESRRLDHGRALPVGASCLAVATKRD